MGKSLTERLKTAVNIARSRSSSPQPGPSNMAELVPAESQQNMHFTEYVVSRLDGQSHKLFARSYAAQMRLDRHAKVIDIDDTLIWLGYARRDEVVRQLQKLYKEDDYIVQRILHTGAEKRGQPKKQYLISLDQFEELMIEAGTEEGRTARRMFRQLKDAVFELISIEKESVQRLLESKKTELEEHKGRSADLAKQIEDLKLSRVTFWLYAYRVKN